MPDLKQLLAAEAAQRQPATVPSFADVRRRARQRRHTRLAATAVAVGAMLTACALVVSLVAVPTYRIASPNPSTTGVRAFATSGLSFDYPATWTPSVWDWGRHGRVIVELSARPLGNPCRTMEPAVTITCGRPVPDLSFGQVYISWAVNSFPLARANPLDTAPGIPTTVGGRPALVDSGPATGRCGALAGGRVIAAIVLLDDTRFDSLTMTACLAAPSARSERQVMDMLASVSLS